MWEGLADRYDRAGWWERRRIEFGLYVFLAFMATLIGIAIIIEKIQSVWGVVRGWF